MLPKEDWSVGQSHYGQRIPWLGPSFVLFQNIDGGLDIYGMLIKVSEDMELEERELMTESVSKQLSTGPLSLNQKDRWTRPSF